MLSRREKQEIHYVNLNNASSSCLHGASSWRFHCIWDKNTRPRVCNSRPIKTLATRISTITWAIILKVACVFLFFSITDEAQLSSPEGPPTKVRLRHLHITNNDAYMCTFCVLSFSYITSWWAMFDLTIIKIQIKGVVLLLHAWQMIDWFSFLFIFLFLGELKLLMRSLKQ